MLAEGLRLLEAQAAAVLERGGQGAPLPASLCRIGGVLQARAFFPGAQLRAVAVLSGCRCSGASQEAGLAAAHGCASTRKADLLSAPPPIPTRRRARLHRAPSWACWSAAGRR